MKSNKKVRGGKTVQSPTDSVSEIVQVDIVDIMPTPDNDKLYKPVDPKDPVIIDKAKDMQKKGVLEPLVISLDNYILSGHRRYCAATLAGLKQVPARIHQIRRRDDVDAFIVLLRSYNRGQRVKTIAETLRESIIDATPEDARAELVAYRLEQAEIELDQIELKPTIGRPSITGKLELMRAICKVIDQNRKHWPLSVRMIHYRVCQIGYPVRRHDSKSELYLNNLKSYRDCSDLCTRGRVFGNIPYSAISDETRPVTLSGVYGNTGPYIASEMNSFLKGYFRDFLQSQPNHFELFCEKNTVSSILIPVAYEFTMPLTSGRGYCSIPPRHGMAQRFKASGKSKLVVLLLSDHDPEGCDLIEAFPRSMRDDFGVDKVYPIRVALTRDQVDEYELPNNLFSKASSSRHKAYVKQHGDNVWELDALSPEQLQDITRESILNVLDLEKFEHERKAELDDAKKLADIRATVFETLKQCDIDFGTDIDNDDDDDDDDDDMEDDGDDMEDDDE